MEKQEILEVLREKGLYDFLAQNYHRLTTEQMKDICKEFDFQCYSIMSKSEYEEARQNAIEELEEVLY